MTFQDTIEEVFDKTTDEYQTITQAYGLLSSPIPMTAAEAKVLMYQLDSIRAKLSAIYFMVSRSLSKQKSAVQNTYDTTYTRLVKIGRPSHTAIEAEIRTLLPDYIIYSDTADKYTQVKELITSFIRGIDNMKVTTLEAFRDSRRVD